MDKKELIEKIRRIYVLVKELEDPEDPIFKTRKIQILLENLKFELDSEESTIFSSRAKTKEDFVVQFREHFRKILKIKQNFEDANPTHQRP